MIKQVLWIYVLVGFVWEVDCPVGSELTILLGLGISGLGLLPAFSITLLLLVLYYEQNLPVLIATQHRSAYRSIKEPNVLEQLLLSQLKKLDHLKVLSRSEQRDFFRKLQTDLDVIQQQTPKLLGLDEIRIWVESRLTGQTMEAIFSSM